jgi:hypothetical protein
VTNAEMHPIEVQDAPLLLQPSLSPRVKLVAQTLVEPTDRTGTGCDSYSGSQKS